MSEINPIQAAINGNFSEEFSSVRESNPIARAQGGATLRGVLLSIDSNGVATFNTDQGHVTGKASPGSMTGRRVLLRRSASLFGAVEWVAD